MTARRKLVALTALLLASIPFGRPAFATSVRPRSVPSISTTSCTPSEVTTLTTAVTDLTAYLANATDYFDAQLKGSRYTSWFGSFDQTRWNRVKATYQAMETAVLAGSIDFDCTMTGCGSATYAYVYPNDPAPYTFYLCTVFWDAGTPNTGTDSRAGTLVHEMSHFTPIGGTDDWQYGKSGAANLALGDPAKAVDNADNYEYFAENSPASESPARSISVASRNFGSQQVGTSSAPFAFTVTNTGDANLTVGTLQFPPGFSASSNTCSGSTVAPSATCSISVVYSPSATGSSSGNLTIPNNTTAGSLTVALTGTGTAAQSAPVSALTSMAPERMLDTRNGIGGVTQPVGNGTETGTPLEFTVAGTHGLPSNAASIAAISLNVTVVDGQAPDEGGYVTVYPCGTRPNASNLNFTNHQTIPNAVITPVSNNGKICFFVYGRTHLIADINGWYPANTGFTPIAPERMLDTRNGIGGVTQPVGNGTETGTPLEFTVAGTHGLPSNAASIAAISLNVTVVDGQAPDEGGYVTVYPCGTRPNASNLNFTNHQTIPNAVITPVSNNGKICFFVYGRTHLIADINGWYPAVGSQ